MVIYTFPTYPYIIFTSRLHSNPNTKKTDYVGEMELRQNIHFKQSALKRTSTVGSVQLLFNNLF